LFDLLLQCGACFMLYRLWSIWFRPWTAWSAMMLYVFYYAHSSSFVVGQRDLYAMLLVFWGVYLLLSQRPLVLLSGQKLFAIGLLFGLSALIRPTFIIYAVILIFNYREIRNIRSSAILLAASALPFLIVLTFYSFVPGGLHELFLATIRFNLDLYTQFSAPILWLINGLFRTLVVIIPFLFLCIPVQRRKELIQTVSRNEIPRRDQRLYWIFFGYTLAIILIQRKFLSYHFGPYVMLQTPVAALGFDMMLSYIPRKYRTTAFVAIGIIAIIPLQKTLEVMAEYHTVFHNGAFPHAQWLAHAMDSAEYPSAVTGDAAMEQACLYLRPVVNENERIEVISFDARLRAELRANSATRFTMLHPIGFRADFFNKSENSFTDYQHHWRSEYMDSLETVKPNYIVLARKTDSWYLKDPYLDVLHYLPGFDTFFVHDYYFDTSFGGYQIFRHVR
jgi:hypothetical protein